MVGAHLCGVQPRVHARQDECLACGRQRQLTGGGGVEGLHEPFVSSEEVLKVGRGCHDLEAKGGQHEHFLQVQLKPQWLQVCSKSRAMRLIGRWRPALVHA